MRKNLPLWLILAGFWLLGSCGSTPLISDGPSIVGINTISGAFHHDSEFSRLELNIDAYVIKNKVSVYLIADEETGQVYMCYGTALFSVCDTYDIGALLNGGLGDGTEETDFE